MFTSHPSKCRGLKPCYTLTRSLPGRSLEKIKFSWSWRDSNPESSSWYNKSDLYSRQRQVWFCSSQHNHCIWGEANFLSSGYLVVILCHRSSCVLENIAQHSFAFAVGSNLKYLPMMWLRCITLRKFEWTLNTQYIVLCGLCYILDIKCLPYATGLQDFK